MKITKNSVWACIIIEQIAIYLLMVQKLLNNMKKTELNWYVYDFSVDYNYTAVDDILDIHKYLIKKNDII